MSIQAISAITLCARDMTASIAFYRQCGFESVFGDAASEFVSLQSGQAFVNLVRTNEYAGTWWGRVIFRVDDVDALYQSLLAAGLSPQAPPRDAEWGERYFHITDPDGHELSFAQPIR